MENNKTLIVLHSFHHKNTEKIAQAIAEVISADIKRPQQVDPKDVGMYGLVGFGSGIYDGKTHKSLIALVDRLPNVINKRAFIFSTSGIPNVFANEELVKENHLLLKEKLQSKGYVVVGEFGCSGWNTNSFLKMFGGINRGRPNTEDIEQAKKFAQSLL